MRPAELTDRTIRGAIARAREAGSTVSVRDGACPGLELRAGSTVASWRLKYADPRDGTRWRLPLGRYPAVTLAEARRRAKEERARIDDPRQRANPAKERRDVSAMPTFRELAELRLAADGRDALKDSTRDYYRWCLETHAYGAIGGMAAGDVRPDDVRAIGDAVASRGSGPLTTADRVVLAVSSVFSWAVRERIIAANPARGIPRRASDSARDRVPDDGEMGRLLAGIYGWSGPQASEELRRILHLIVLTGARSSEVRLAERPELHWDGYAGHGGPVWVVPGDRLVRGRRVRGRSKSGQAVVRPLSRQAADLFRLADAAAGERDGLFDVAERRFVSYAMERACERAGLVGDARVVPHDARRALSTWLGDRGERPDTIELMMGHTRKGVTRKHYNLSLLLPLVANAYQRWADHLQALLSNPPAP